ncbi:hypothetical protein Tco_0762085 [Tanacetum coccineum]
MSKTNNNLQTQTSNALHNAIIEAGGKDRPPMLALGYMENYKNVSQDIRDQLIAEAEAVQIILTGIDNDIYFIVDACPNACEMWKAIERLKQDVQELKTVPYHKLYDILKQHQTEVNEIRAERLARTYNPLALFAQHNTVLPSSKHPTHYINNSSTRSQQLLPETEVKQLSTLLHLLMIKNLLRKSTNLPTTTFELNQTPVELIKIILQESTEDYLGSEHQRVVNVAGARENVGTPVVPKISLEHLCIVTLQDTHPTSNHVTFCLMAKAYIVSSMVMASSSITSKLRHHQLALEE